MTVESVIYAQGALELRYGHCDDALADVDGVDVIVTDPPYGPKTHDGHAARTRTDIRDPAKMPAPLPYAAWTPADVTGFVRSWAPRCRGWFVACTSHDLFPTYAAELEAAGRYVFAPLPLVSRGMSTRLSGDGPSSWCTWVVVARPRTVEFSRWGTLPGEYRSKRPDSAIAGGKHVDVMRAIVRDYSRPGDLICDPCAGGATTLIAAVLERRRAIGSELMRETYDKAVTRLDGQVGRGYTPDLFAHPAREPQQLEVFA